MTYTEYMKKVDNILASRLEGLTSEDLPDTCTRDNFNNRIPPSECADLIMENAFESVGWVHL